MDDPGIGRRGLPKFREILRRPRNDSEVCILNSSNNESIDGIMNCIKL